MTDGLPKLKSLSKFPSIKSIGGKQNRALETSGSNLQKFLETINKPTSAINTALMGEGFKKGWNKDTPGSDVLRKYAGRDKNAPSTGLEKALFAGGGLALDVVNPINPINWLGIGGVTKAGKALQASGKLAKLSKGLQTGERSIANLGKLHTPELVNKLAGYALEGTGKVVSSVPGAKALKNLFTSKLAPIARFIRPAEQKLDEALRPVFNKVDESQKLFEKAQKSVGNIPPERLAGYKALGLTPKEIVDREVGHILESPMVGKQQSVVDKLTKQATRNTLAGSSAKVQLAEILKTPKVVSSTSDIEAFASHLGKSNESIKQRLIDAGLKTEKDFIHTGYHARSLSEPYKNLMLESGVGAGGGGASRTLGTELTRGQVEALSKTPEFKAQAIAGNFGIQNVPANKGLIERLSKKASEKGSLASFYDPEAVKSLAKRSVKAETEISTGGMVKEIAETIGAKNAESAFKKWGVETSYRGVDIPKKFEGFAGTKKLFLPTEEAGALQHVLNNVATPQKVEGLLKLHDNMLSIFKQTTLFGTPLIGTPTSLRNLVSNIFMSDMVGASSIEGAVKSLPLMKLFVSRDKLKASGAWEKMIQGMASTGVKTDAGEVVPLSEIANFLDKSGAFRGSMMRDIKNIVGQPGAMGKVQKFLDKSLVTGIPIKVNDAVEYASRAQHFITRVKQGWTMPAALDDMLKTQYDYSGVMLSDFENKVLRRTIPFYQWMRNNIPAMLFNTIKSPKKAANIQRAISAIEGETEPIDERSLDEFIKGDLHVRLGKGKDGNPRYFRLKGFLPIADLEDITSVDRAVDLFLSGMSPFLKLPIEQTTNQSLFFKGAGGEPAKIERYKGESGEFLGQQMPKKVINVLRNARLLNELDKYLPLSKRRPQLSGKEKLAKFLAAQPRPVDMKRSLENAKMQYKQRANQLKSNKTREQALGYDTTNIEKMLTDLQAKSYQP